MAEAIATRKFTAEIRRAHRSNGANPVSDWSSIEITEQLERVLSGIDGLRSEIAAVAAGGAIPVVASTEVGMVATQSDHDSLVLRVELQHLHHAIERTKREIAVMGRNGSTKAPLKSASNELDAVVQATEGATNVILAAAERIDEIVGQLRNQASREEVSVLDESSEQVVKIFEACNFQDITGQRISKVVTAMKFIEKRVDRMIEILGGPGAFAGLEAIEDWPVNDEVALLAGPQLDCDTKISQDDIDRFFN